MIAITTKKVWRKRKRRLRNQDRGDVDNQQDENRRWRWFGGSEDEETPNPSSDAEGEDQSFLGGLHDRIFCHDDGEGGPNIFGNLYNWIVGDDKVEASMQPSVSPSLQTCPSEQPERGSMCSLSSELSCSFG